MYSGQTTASRCASIDLDRSLGGLRSMQRAGASYHKRCRAVIAMLRFRFRPNRVRHGQATVAAGSLSRRERGGVRGYKLSIGPPPSPQPSPRWGEGVPPCRTESPCLPTTTGVSSMTRIVVAALALLLACSTLSAGPAAAQAPPELKNDMIEVEYNEPKNQKYRPIYERMK